MKFFKFFYLILISFPVTTLLGQETQSYSFDTSMWSFSGNYQIIELDGQESLLFQDDANATLKGVKLKNAIIDLDVMVSNIRGFGGVMFRMQNSQHYENFYIRYHQSGNPDAIQYTPVYHDLAAWQLYKGANHTNAVSFNYDEWMHLRLAIFDDQMEVFIDDMNYPVLHVFDLKQESQAGMIGLWGGNACQFANVKVSAIEDYQFKSKKVTIPKLADGFIKTWKVSEAVSQDFIDKHTNNSSEWENKLKWETLACDFTGIVNLAKRSNNIPPNNTVIAKFEIYAEQDQVKELKFGYSDEAKIYLNQQALYQGERYFRSRDYRYLGTIGTYDRVFLHLKKGLNTVHFAVTEDFGGWGVMAQLLDLKGLKVKSIN